MTISATVAFVLCGSIVFGGLIPRVRQIGSWAFLPLLVFMLTEQPASGVGIWSILALAAGLAWLVVPVILPQVAPLSGDTVFSNLRMEGKPIQLSVFPMETTMIYGSILKIRNG